MDLTREDLHTVMENVNEVYSKRTLIKGQVGLAVYSEKGLAICEPIEYSAIAHLDKKLTDVVKLCPEGMMAVLVAEKIGDEDLSEGAAVPCCRPYYVGFVGLKNYYHEEGAELLQRAYAELGATGNPVMGGLSMGDQTLRLEPANDNPGRNEKCRCGSGSKYKKCCGRFDNN